MAMMAFVDALINGGGNRVGKDLFKGFVYQILNVNIVIQKTDEI